MTRTDEYCASGSIPIHLSSRYCSTQRDHPSHSATPNGCTRPNPTDRPVETGARRRRNAATHPASTQTCARDRTGGPHWRLGEAAPHRILRGRPRGRWWAACAPRQARRAEPAVPVAARRASRAAHHDHGTQHAACLISPHHPAADHARHAACIAAHTPTDADSAGRRARQCTGTSTNHAADLVHSVGAPEPAGHSSATATAQLTCPTGRRAAGGNAVLRTAPSAIPTVRRLPPSTLRTRHGLG